MDATMIYGAAILVSLGVLAWIAAAVLWAETVDPFEHERVPTAPVHRSVRVVPPPYDWMTDDDLRKWRHAPTI